MNQLKSSALIGWEYLRILYVCFAVCVWMWSICSLTLFFASIIHRVCVSILHFLRTTCRTFPQRAVRSEEPGREAGEDVMSEMKDVLKNVQEQNGDKLKEETKNERFSFS